MSTSTIVYLILGVLLKETDYMLITEESILCGHEQQHDGSAKFCPFCGAETGRIHTVRTEKPLWRNIPESPYRIHNGALTRFARNRWHGDPWFDGLEDKMHGVGIMLWQGKATSDYDKVGPHPGTEWAELLAARIKLEEALKRLKLANREVRLWAITDTG